MAFDRFSIAEAHCVLEWDYNKGGWLHERPSNRRRMEATSIQLSRIGFRPRMDLSFDSLDEEGKEIYYRNVLKWKLPVDEDMLASMRDFFVPEFLARYPLVKNAFSGMYEAA